jgi:hypothetical protein
VPTSDHRRRGPVREARRVGTGHGALQAAAAVRLHLGADRRRLRGEGLRSPSTGKSWQPAASGEPLGAIKQKYDVQIKAEFARRAGEVPVRRRRGAQSIGPALSPEREEPGDRVDREARGRTPCCR